MQFQGIKDVSGLSWGTVYLLNAPHGGHFVGISRPFGMISGQANPKMLHKLPATSKSNKIPKVFPLLRSCFGKQTEITTPCFSTW